MPVDTATATEVAETERVIRQLEVTVTRKLDGLLHGDYAGLVPGNGSDPAGGRIYEPGDDVRRIDWNLTARSMEPHVRTTIAERELETWLVVDATASLQYGTTRREKRDLALAVAGAFGFLAGRVGNRVGAVVFDGARSEVLPPRNGRDGVLALLRALHRRGDGATGDVALADALRKTRSLARRRGLVVVVSDLLGERTWSRDLAALSARHDVVVARVSDPREDHLPSVGMLTLVDPETGELREVQTSKRRFREHYAAAAAERRDAVLEEVRRANARILEVSTDRDWLPDVVRFVVSARRRR